MADTQTLPNPVIPDVPIPAVPNRPKVSANILAAANKVKEQFRNEATEQNARSEERKVARQLAKTETTETLVSAKTTEAVEIVTPKGDPQEGLKAAIAPTDRETNIANLRRGREESDAKVKALEQQLAEVQSRIPSDYEQIKKDRETLISEIEKRDVTASPRFKEKYDKPMEQQANQIKKTLGLTDVNSDDFLAIVQMPESKERNAKLGEMMEPLDRVSSGKVETALSEYDRIRDQRAQDISDPKQAWQENRRDLEDRQKQARQQQATILEGAIEHAEKVVPWFKPIEGNDAWNSRISDTKQKARDFWSGAHSSEELAQLTLAGTMAPLITEALSLAQKENERLNTELSELKSAKPKTAAGTSSSASTGKTGKYGGHGNLGAMIRAQVSGKE